MSGDVIALVFCGLGMLFSKHLTVTDQASHPFLSARLRCACDFAPSRTYPSPSLIPPALFWSSATGLEATGRHSWAGVGGEVAEGWKVSLSHDLCNPCYGTLSAAQLKISTRVLTWDNTAVYEKVWLVAICNVMSNFLEHVGNFDAYGFCAPVWIRRKGGTLLKKSQVKSSQVKSSQVKACRPEGSPFRAQANEMQDFIRSTSVQREKYKILFKPHPMTILKSLHNPVVKAFPNTISFQRYFPSVGRSSACPSSSDVPMQNPASPTFRRQRCNIRSELPYCLDACDRPRFQSSVVRQHLYFVVPPM